MARPKKKEALSESVEGLEVAVSTNLQAVVPVVLWIAKDLAPWSCGNYAAPCRNSSTYSRSERGSTALILSFL
jgi:hypothetical protein